MEQPKVTLTMNHYRELEQKAKAHDDELITIKLTEDWPEPERIEIIAHNGNEGLHYETNKPVWILSA